MRYGIYLLLAGFLATATLFAGPKERSEAAWDWCYGDPLIVVNGQIIDIQVGVPLTKIGQLKGPIDLRVEVPSNVEAKTLLNPSLLYPVNVNIVHTSEVWDGRSSVNVKVSMYAPASSSFDVSMLVTHQNAGLRIVDIKQITGKTNQTFSGSFKLGGLRLLGIL